MRSVLIVGSGATGAAAAHALSGAVRAGQLTVSVWDKARGAGGRMNTTRSPFDDKVTADLGAQYLTRRKGDSPRVAAAYQELLDAGTIAPLRSTIRGDRGGDEVIANYTAPGGINRVVKHFLLAAVDGGVSTTFRRTVVGVSPEAGDSGPGWRVHAADGATERFDAVILTVPAPQLLTLGGEWKDRLDRPAVGASGQPLPSTATVREVLKSTRFSSRYAVALFYRDPRALDAIGDWGGHYVDGDECLRFASRDCVKRGLMPEGGCSLVLHTSVPYGIRRADDNAKEVEAEVVAAARRHFPALPASADWSRTIRWRYSQASRPATDTGGALLLDEAGPLVAAGDYMAASNFGGCITSAHAAVDALERRWGVTLGGATDAGPGQGTSHL